VTWQLTTKGGYTIECHLDEQKNFQRTWLDQKKKIKEKKP